MIHGHTGDGFCVCTVLLSNMYGTDIMLFIPRLYRLLLQQTAWKLLIDLASAKTRADSTHSRSAIHISSKFCRLHNMTYGTSSCDMEYFAS